MRNGSFTVSQRLFVVMGQIQIRMEVRHKYFAFISYRGADVGIAKKLQKKFNNFKLPSTYTNPFDENNQRMQPVCRDRDNFVGGDVTAQINDAIDRSMYVVMVCTPNMTQSDDRINYVNDEVRHLIDTGRLDHLIPLVFEGIAYTPDDYMKAKRSVENPFPDECLPYALRVWMSEHNDHGFTLNIFNVEEQGERDEDKMFLRCVATILAEEFNKLWDRFKIEQKKRKRNIVISIVLTIIVFIFAIIAAISFTQPIDVKVKLTEMSLHNENLPALKDAIVTISIDDYANSDTIACIEDIGLLDKVPYSYIGKNVHLTVRCKNWLPLDTVVNLANNMSINVARDSHPYGNIQFCFWNVEQECKYPNTRLSINGHETTSDEGGYVTYSMPLAEQSTYYIIETSMPLVSDTLYMPTTESTIIEVK